MSYGEKAVGLSFNPSGDPAVDTMKRDYAKIIDALHDLRRLGNTEEQQRLCSIAITEAQAAQMWAVKAITWNGKG